MHLVRIIIDEQMQKVDNPVWHLVQVHGEGERTVCSGEVFGYGESGGESEEKHTGKITCPRCIEIVKWYKSIKL